MLNGDGAVGVVNGNENVEVSVCPGDTELGGHHGQAAFLPPIGLKQKWMSEWTGLKQTCIGLKQTCIGLKQTWIGLKQTWMPLWNGMKQI